MESKRTTEESTDRGVSPVIGVILMVAITVILAAVIAAFVLDIGPGETDPSASFSADVDGDDIVDVELNSLGSNTDGIVVVADTGDDGDFAGSPLEVSGQSATYGETNGNFSSDTALVAYSGGEDLGGGSDLGDVDNFAIIDNLEEIDSE